MKRINDIVLFVLISLCLFTACVKPQKSTSGMTDSEVNDPQKELIGKYVVQSVNGMTPKEYVLEHLMQNLYPEDEAFAKIESKWGITEEEVNNDFMSLEFKEDGTAFLGGWLYEKIYKTIFKGTWELDGASLTIKGEDTVEDTIELSFENGLITGDMFNDGSFHVVFRKSN